MNKLLLFILVTASALCFSCTDQTADLEENSAIVKESQYKGVGSKDPFRTKREMIAYAQDFINTVNPPEPDMSWISSSIKPPTTINTTFGVYNSLGVMLEEGVKPNSYKFWIKWHVIPVDFSDPIDYKANGTMSSGGQILSYGSANKEYANLKPFPLFQTVQQIPVYYNMIEYKRNFEDMFNGELYGAKILHFNAYMVYLDKIHKAKTGWTVQEWLDET